MTQLWPTDIQRKSTQFAATSAVLLLVSFSLTVVFGLSHEEPVLKPYPVIERGAYIPSLDPTYAVRTGISPMVPEKKNPQPSQAVKALVVYPTGAVLYEGGVPSQAVAPVGNSEVVTLHDLVAMVDNPSWLEEHDTVVTVHCPVITVDPTEFVIDGAETTKVILDQAGGAFLSAAGGSFTTRNVEITGSNNAPQSTKGNKFRPFFEANGVDAPVTLDIDHTKFSNLGWDWHNSYGLSLIGAVTGSIRNSEVAKTYFGVYTDRLRNFTIQDSIFSRNTVYGIDLHTNSHDLTIVGNTANHNGSHGIVGSVDVTASTFTGNTSSFNGEDGIVLDARSDANMVKANIVTNNRGDGIAVTGSKKALLLNNVIRHNRIGIRVDEESTAKARHNVVFGNVLPAQGIELSTTLNRVDVEHNSKTVPPSKWHFIINFAFWPATLVACLLAIAARRRERSQFPNYRFSNDPSLQKEKP